MIKSLTAVTILLGMMTASVFVVCADEPPTPNTVAKGVRLAPKIFRAAAAKVRPSIVAIETFGASDASATRQGSTTGLIIDSSGYVLTSTFHFAGKPPVITVVLPNGDRHVARLMGRDDARKLCVVKVDKVSNWPTPTFAPANQTRVGQWAISLGVGYGGDEPALSTGIISALRRVSGRAVQTDANISPANYGGPLIDIRGRVIGLCTPLQPGSEEVNSGVRWYDSGIGFAIPLGGADRLLTALMKGETIAPAFLGVELNDQPGASDGAVIKGIQKDSPAEKAELQSGNIIQQVNKVEIVSAAELKAELGSRLPGDEIQLSIMRSGEKEVVSVVLGAAPKGAGQGGNDQPVELEIEKE